MANPVQPVPSLTFSKVGSIDETNALAKDVLLQLIDHARAINSMLMNEREFLIEDRTYYVRTDGDDGNTGLDNDAGGAFLTIQAAIDAVGALDTSIHDVTISVGAGTFTTSTGATVTLKNFVGAGRCTIQGAGATTIIDSTGDYCIFGEEITSRWSLEDVKLTADNIGIGLSRGSTLRIDNVDFGLCSVFQMLLFNSKIIVGAGGYSISDDAAYHMLLSSASLLETETTCTVTLTGTPTFSSFFASVQRLSFYRPDQITFSGSATGTRYEVKSNSVIDTSGGGANFLPGNAAGSTASGGQYL